MKKILSLFLSLMLVGIVMAANVSLPYKLDSRANQMGTISPTSVTYNYYNADNKLSEAITYRNSNLSIPSQIETFTYNELGNITAEILYIQESDVLKIYYKNVYSYNGDNRLVKKEVFTSMGDEIKCTEIVEYIYDGDRLVKEVNNSYSYVNNVLDWAYDIDYKTFNNIGLPLTADKTVMYNQEEGKIIAEKMEYGYDAAGNRIFYLKKMLVSDGVYADNRKDNIVYTATNKIYTHDMYITDMSVIADQLKYTYDDSDNLIKMEINGNSWDQPGTLVLNGDITYTNINNYSNDNAPRNFKVSNNGNGGVKLTWDSPLNVASLLGFDIFVDGVKYGEMVTDNQKVISELLVGEHFFMVQAKYDEIGANTSDVIYFDIVDANCVEPTNVVLTGELVFDEGNESTTVNISWTAPVTTYSVLGYKLYVNGNLIDLLITETNYKDRVFMTGDYVYELIAVYKEGNSQKSEPLSVKVVTKFKVTLGTQTPPWVTLTGAGWHYDGSDVTIKAEPKTGYEFMKWTEKLDGDGGFLDVSTEAEYTFKITRSTAFSATLRPANGIDDLNSNNVRIYSIGRNIQIKTDTPVSKVDVIDLTGKIIKSFTTTNNVNVDNSGVYVVRVSCGDNTLSKKIIVK